MSKRNGRSDQREDVGYTKKPRSVNDTHSDDLIDVEFRRAVLSPRIAVQTFRLVRTIQCTITGFRQRMQAVIALLKSNAEKNESLLDLSLVIEGDQVSQVTSALTTITTTLCLMLNDLFFVFSSTHCVVLLFFIFFWCAVLRVV